MRYTKSSRVLCRKIHQPLLRQNFLFPNRKKTRLTEIAHGACRASGCYTRSDGVSLRVIAIASVTGLGDHNPGFAEGSQVEHGRYRHRERWILDEEWAC